MTAAAAAILAERRERERTAVRILAEVMRKIDSSPDDPYGVAQQAYEVSIDRLVNAMVELGRFNTGNRYGVTRSTR